MNEVIKHEKRPLPKLDDLYGNLELAGNGSLSLSNQFTSMVPALEAFTKRLNEPPPASEVSINEQANGAKYLPISFVDNKLDETFAGLWNWELIREQVIANEIIGTGLLEVFHPIAKVWIRRTGSAAAMIQLKSGSEINIQNKIKNTLVKDFPHLEAECRKNAAKKLGKMFGRDLNRKLEDLYEPIYTQEIEANEALEPITDRIAACKTIEELTAIWKEFPHLQANPHFKKHFGSKRQQLNLK